jgi:RHS repeat-associated protein
MWYTLDCLAAARTGFIHSDHLGSTSLTTDITGTLVAETRYLPYGEERWITGTLVTDFTFTGQRAERGFGLMDYNARYYDPWLGRFISPDSIVPNPRNPQDLNRYSYVRSNPLRHTDPSGQVLCGGVNECSGGGYQAYSYYMSAQDTQTAVENAGKVVQAGAVGVLTLLGATVAIPYVYSAHAAVATASAAHPTAAAVVGGLAETAAECAMTGGGCTPTDYIIGGGTAGLANRVSTPRNPYGKAGGPAHQSGIEEIVGDLEVLYADNPSIEIFTEYRVRTPYGEKAYRDVDVAAVDVTTGKPVSVHQVGVQEGGAPVPRELQAIDDIERATGIRPQFHNYNWD